MKLFQKLLHYASQSLFFLVQTAEAYNKWNRETKSWSLLDVLFPCVWDWTLLAACSLAQSMTFSLLSSSGLTTPKLAICPCLLSSSPTIYWKSLARNRDFGDYKELCSVAFHWDSVHKYVHTQAQSHMQVQSDYGSERFLLQIFTLMKPSIWW